MDEVEGKTAADEGESGAALAFRVEPVKRELCPSQSSPMEDTDCKRR